jgi:hypothetical protein
MSWARRDDVLDADETRVRGVAVEEDTLREVLIDLVAVMMGFHLHPGVAFRHMDTVEVHRNLRPRVRGMDHAGGGGLARAGQF